MSREPTATTRLAVVASQDGRFEVRLPVASLKRLATQVTAPDAAVSAALDAGAVTVATGQRQRRLAGTARLEWSTRCQRCLEAMVVPVTAPIDVLVSDDDTLDDTGQTWDVWAETGGATLGDVVEEYVLLALPFAPAHDAGDCAGAETAADTTADEPAPTRRPFADLNNLLREAGESAARTPPAGGTGKRK